MISKLKLRFNKFENINLKNTIKTDAIHVNKGPSLAITEPYRFGTMQLAENP